MYFCIGKVYKTSFYILGTNAHLFDVFHFVLVLDGTRLNSVQNNRIIAMLLLPFFVLY